jgi:V/A-type H+/Na+-transporting ATPase subunit I
MAIIPLQKIRVFVPNTDASRLVDLLQNAGCSEIIADAEFPENPKLEEIEATLVARHHHARIEMARNFFSQYHQDGFLRSTFEGAKEHTTQTDLSSTAETTDLEAIISKVENFQQAMAELDRTERTTIESLTVLNSWERFELPLNAITETKLVAIYALRGAERAINKTIADLKSNLDPLISIQEVSNTTALLTFLKSDRVSVDTIINGSAVDIVVLPNTTSTAREEMNRLEKIKLETINQREQLITEISNSAKEYLPSLKKLSDAARWKLEQSETQANLPGTERTTFVTAWTPVNYLPALEQSLNTSLPTHALEKIDTADTEIVPTHISNQSWLKPFETVTNLYGSPYHRDLDPTPVLALFFFLFFSICLSDAGYGILLMTLTGLILWKYKLEAGIKQMMTLLFYGGLGTTVAGIMFGGYFGVTAVGLASLFPPLTFLETWQSFDPINEPMPVFYLALLLGFVQVCFGIALNLYRKIKINQVTEALLDDAPWLYVFLLIALYIASSAGYLNENLTRLLSENTLLIAGSAIIAIVFTQGRHQKNPVMKLLSGILGLYSIVGYFADILSYSRLMALGLATGALALSINSIAVFVGGDSLGFGTIVMVLILIFGHALNIAISLLGTFINSARLQFVEFFSKFTTGTGRPFSPFYKETKHVIILPDPPGH